jgi:hypothetical protein
MHMRKAVYTPPQAGKPVVTFDYRFELVPYQKFDTAITLSVPTSLVPEQQGCRMTLRINPQRLAASLAAAG